MINEYAQYLKLNSVYIYDGSKTKQNKSSIIKSLQRLEGLYESQAKNMSSFCWMSLLGMREKMATFY